MAKVITFSRVFPAYHTRVGRPTYFVEKIFRGLHVLIPEAKSIMDMRVWSECTPKLHTIRSGKRWKTGDWFSPRVWSDKPYNSPQIVIAPALQLVRVADFEIDGCMVYVDNKLYCVGLGSSDISELAQNDGLSVEDFQDWFNKPVFSGQILIWSNKELPY